MGKRVLAWALVAAVMAGIFYFSGQNEAASSGLSVPRATALYRLLVGLKIMPDDPLFTLIHTLVRKSAHVALYLLLSLSLLNALRLYPLPPRRAVGIDLIICLAYAASDEWHQTFVPGRAGRVTDVGVDMLGALLGVALFALLAALWRNIRKRKQGAEAPQHATDHD